MIYASEIYNQYKSEIKAALAKEKLLRGTTRDVALVTMDKALSLYEGDVFEYYDNMSGYLIDTSSLENKAIPYIYYNRISNSNSIVNASIINVEDFNYSMPYNSKGSNYLLRGTNAVKHLTVSKESISKEQLVHLSDMPNLEKCIICDRKDLRDCEKTVVIDTCEYRLFNCFNNQHYDYVYLGRTIPRDSRSVKGVINCFNNCTIDTLVIENGCDIGFNSFKFTSANNIVISNQGIEYKHLINRLTYMRGIKNV